MSSSSPFQFFTDHSTELGKLVTEGRRREFNSFASFSEIPDPQAEQTFLDSKLHWDEASDSPTLRLYQECLRLRREDAVLREHDRFGMAAEAGTDDLLTVRFSSDSDRRLLVANFGHQASVPNEGLGRILLDTSEGQLAHLQGESLVAPTQSAVLLG